MLHLTPGPHPLGFQALQRLSDDDLMVRLQAGEADALAVLFDRYHRLVYSIALQIVRDAGEAEDVVQTVFLDVFRAAAQFDRSKGTTKVWLLQYAYHRAISRKRYLNVRSFYDWEEQEQAAGVPLAGDRPALGMTAEELKDLLAKGLASLSASQRRVIEQASFDGLSMKEIAERTGDSFASVRHHYYRGLRKLRAFIERQDDVEEVVGDA